MRLVRHGADRLILDRTASSSIRARFCHFRQRLGQTYASLIALYQQQNRPDEAEAACREWAALAKKVAPGGR